MIPEFFWIPLDWKFVQILRYTTIFFFDSFVKWYQQGNMMTLSPKIGFILLSFFPYPTQCNNWYIYHFTLHMLPINHQFHPYLFTSSSWSMAQLYRHVTCPWASLLKFNLYLPSSYPYININKQSFEFPWHWSLRNQVGCLKD